MEPHEVEEKVRRELGREEQLLWYGRPRQGLMVRRADLFTIPFSVVWCGFAIFWESNAVGSNAPLFFTIWGIPFVLLGLYMVFGRFLMDAAERKRMVYGLTNERVLIVGGLFHRGVRSLRLRALGEVSLTERSDGTGTITLGAAPEQHVWQGRRQTAPSALEGIDHARTVYDHLRQAQKTAP